ncbi:MAG: hypothetical protein QM227_08820 [Bacillota bacterium]|jgi:hypothetical protein|nr:hypothetical protein [Bacillota bacterium]NLL59654.1 hypothetical protein [Tissierellia bacterium]
MSYSSNTGKYKKSDVYKFNVNDNSNYERTGFLEITVTDAQTGMPIENVDIEVFKMTIMGEYAERAEEAI